MKEKLIRCGDCGDFQVSSLRELQNYSQLEQNNAELIHCGCINYSERYVSRDMAIDAGDLSLEGQRY